MLNKVHDIYNEIVAKVSKYRYIIALLLVVSVLFTGFVLDILVILCVCLILGYLLYKVTLYVSKISFWIFRLTVGVAAVVIAVTGLIWIVGHL